jgi:hypothetical protein
MCFCGPSSCVPVGVVCVRGGQVARRTEKEADKIVQDCILYHTLKIKTTRKTKLHGLSPRANYTDRATAACRRSDCQLVRIEGDTCSA